MHYKQIEDCNFYFPQMYLIEAFITYPNFKGITGNAFFKE